MSTRKPPSLDNYPVHPLIVIIAIFSSLAIVMAGCSFLVDLL